MRNLILYNRIYEIIISNKYIYFFIKFSIKIIFFFILLYFKKLNILYNQKVTIEIDNKINESLYEDDLDFSRYSTKIKAIAIYYPQFIYLNHNDLYNDKIANEWKNVHNAKPFFSQHKQPRSLNWKYIKLLNNNFSIIDYIKLQVKIAKNHGIYGFAINYYWFSGKKLYDEAINIFLNNKEINFPFFIIWKNDKYELNFHKKNNILLLKQNFTINDTYNFIKDIKKYLISKYYIKYNKRPILGIYEPLIIYNLKTFISHLRKYASNNGIGKLYILGTIDNHYLNYIKYFDAVFEYPPKNINLNELVKNKYYYYYEGLIYRENIKNEYDNIYKGIILEFDNSPKMMKNPLIFTQYSPEKLYLFIKRIISSIKNNDNRKNIIVFINGWNNWIEGTYLEPDDKLGFASLNSLSKALFNINFTKANYNLENLKINCKVAIQIHIFYEDLIIDIINKTNNIPIKFDLFISTNSIEIKNKLKIYIVQYSKANQYEIIILENKGRDVLPLLIQLKNKVKKYKYLCHIHSKKSKTSPAIGISWRNYLYNNLLGNKRIVSEILSDFENNDRLGFIFPDTFYDIINQKLILTKNTLKYMKYIINKLFHNYKLGTQLDFPAGNMFWARTNAIFQIFEIDFHTMFDKEMGQTNDTIMHAIERIWLYLVKLNGYYYKTIIKSLS